MKASERDRILLYVAALNDRYVEWLYYHTVFASLDCEVEGRFMCDRPFESVQERQRYLAEKADILEGICQKRGIKLWT